jgi:hypothetical protein
MLDPSSSPASRLEHSPPMRARPRIRRDGGLLRANLWTGNVGSQSQAFSVARFSPKLWTVLNQYGAGGPYVMGLHE